MKRARFYKVASSRWSERDPHHDGQEETRRPATAGATTQNTSTQQCLGSEGSGRHSCPSNQAEVDEASLASSLPAPLTKENLRRLEEMTNSKGPPTATTTPSKLESRATSEGKTRISTTDTGFKEIFRANHGLTCYESQAHPYANKSQIRHDFFQSRDSASPPPLLHLTIGQMLSEAVNERDIEKIVSQQILKDIGPDLELFGMGYKAKFDKQWVAFPENVGFNNGLSPPKPDLTEGYIRTTFPPIINGLGGCATLVKDSPYYVALPHFVAEFKDVGKNMNQAELQAGYDGAAMVYARNQALAYLGQPDPPRHAAVASVITDGHNWKVFVHYSHENEKTKEVEWYQIRVTGGDLYDYEDFKTGRRVMRNVQDWSRKQSTDLRDRLQQHYDTYGSPVGVVASVSGRKSKNNSDAMSKASSSGQSSGKDMAARAPSSHSSGISNKRDTPSPVRKATPSASQSVLSSTPSKQAGKNAMPPPPKKSSGALSGQDGAPKTPIGKKEARQPSQGKGMAGGPRPDAPSPLNVPAASGDRRPPQGRVVDGRNLSGDRGQRSDAVNSARGRPVNNRDTGHPRPSQVRDDRDGSRGRDQNDYREYRDRSSDDGLVPVQRRRSDSPVDKARLPRPLGADTQPGSRSRDSREGRYEWGSASSSSTGSTRVSDKPLPAAVPLKAKSGMFSNQKLFKKPQSSD